MIMKKIIVMMLLTVSMIISGCTTKDSNEAQSEKEVNAENNATSGANENAEEIELPNGQPDFDTVAEVILGDEIIIDGSGIELIDEQILTITEGGEYSFIGTLEDGMIYIDTDDDVMLTLNGISITNNDGPAIYAENSSSLYINTVSETTNTLTDGSEYQTDDAGEAIGKGTIFSNDDLYFVGDGILNVAGNYKHAIKSDDSIFVESGTLELAATKDGINANDTTMIDGGTITITKAEEGIEGTFVVVNDGNLDITVNDDGINAATDLQVNGGSIYVICTKGDALDSNGSIEISGGTMVLHGAEMPEGGIDCDQSQILITGGTILATGGTNSSPNTEENTQYSILLGSATPGDSIGILDEEGNTVFAFYTEISYMNLLVSIANIEEGKNYTIYTGGTISGGTEYHGYYQDATYEGGTESQTFVADSLVISAGGTADSMMGGMMNGGPGGFGGGKGEWSEDMEMPEQGEMPEGMEMPEQGEMPEGMEMPDPGEMPEGMEPPTGERPQWDSSSNNTTE